MVNHAIWAWRRRRRSDVSWQSISIWVSSCADELRPVHQMPTWGDDLSSAKHLHRVAITTSRTFLRGPFATDIQHKMADTRRLCRTLQLLHARGFPVICCFCWFYNPLIAPWFNLFCNQPLVLFCSCSHSQSVGSTTGCSLHSFVLIVVINGSVIYYLFFHECGRDALFALHTVDNIENKWWIWIHTQCCTGSDIKGNRIVCNIQQRVKFQSTTLLQRVKSWFHYLNKTKITIQKLKMNENKLLGGLITSFHSNMKRFIILFCTKKKELTQFQICAALKTRFA